MFSFCPQRKEIRTQSYCRFYIDPIVPSGNSEIFTNKKWSAKEAIRPYSRCIQQYQNAAKKWHSATQHGKQAVDGFVSHLRLGFFLVYEYSWFNEIKFGHKGNHISRLLLIWSFNWPVCVSATSDNFNFVSNELLVNIWPA